MMVRRRIHGVDRAQDLTDEAIFCRRYGHTPAAALPPRAMREDLAKKGQAAALIKCPVCGRTTGEIVDLDTWEVIGRITPKYPAGYLLKDGQGRMPRAQARREYAARTGHI